MKNLKLASAFLLFLSMPLLAQETILVIDTGHNSTRNKVLVKKAQERGQKIVFYPPAGQNIDSKKLKDYLSTAKFETLILAGHSGDGDFSGTRGEITKEDFLAAISQNEYARKNCHRLLTLGCNTSNKAKAWYYRAMFDDLKLLYGFSDSAPYSYTKNSLNYVESFFNRFDDLEKARTEEELTELFKRMTAVDQVNSGIYVRCEAGEFFYSKEVDEGTPGVLEKYELMSGCDEKQKEFMQHYRPGLNEYLLGLKEPEKDSSQGFLRDAYTFINQNIQCLEGEDFDFTVNKAMMLLFNENFLKNYLAYYRPIFVKAEAELKALAAPGKLEAFLIKSLDLRISNIKKCMANPGWCEEMRKTALEQLKDVKEAYEKLENQGVVTQEEFNRLSELLDGYDTYYEIESFNQEDLKEQLSQWQESRKKINDYIPEYKERLTKVQKIVQKIVSNPQEVTRRDLVSAGDFNLYFEDESIRYTNRMSDALYVVQELEIDIPFAWHEAPRKEIPDLPNGYNVNIMLNKQEFSPEIKYLKTLSY